MSNQDVTFDQLKELCELYKHTDKEVEITFTKDSISVNITNPIRYITNPNPYGYYDPMPVYPQYNRSVELYNVKPTCTFAGGYSSGISDN